MYAGPWIGGMILAYWSLKLKSAKFNVFSIPWVRYAVVMGTVCGTIFGMYLTHQIFIRNSYERLPLWLITAIGLGRNVGIIPCLMILNFNELKRTENVPVVAVNGMDRRENLVFQPNRTDAKYLFWLNPLAKIGYACYLCHFAVINLLVGDHIENTGVGKDLFLFGYFAKVILYSIAAGATMKLTIEQPFYNLYMLLSSGSKAKTS